MTFTLNFLVSFLIVFIANFNSADEWLLKKDSNGIKVYIKNDESAKIKEFKAITIIETNIENVNKLIGETEKASKWMSNVTETKVIKKVSNNEQYVYSVIDMPWPVDDRDIIINSKTIRSGGNIKIEMNGVPNYAPKKEGFIRMPISNGSWTLIKESDNKTKVIYQFLADPGGNIPAWVINMFLVDGPYETLINMKKMLKN